MRASSLLGMRVTAAAAFALASFAACEPRSAPGGEERNVGHTTAALVTPTAPLVCLVDADPTGVKDATAAFEDALACATKNALAPVVVPKGTFSISKKLVVPTAVSVVGDPAGTVAPSTAAGPSAFDTLPTLRFPAAFADDALELSDRASVTGVVIAFAGPQSKGKAALRIAGLGNSIQRVRVVNAGIGIYSPAEVNAGRLYINQIEILESTIGVWADFGLDISRFENIHVLRATVAPDTYGLIFGRNDYMLASKVSTAGVATGVEFRESGQGGGSIASLTGYNSNGCTLGLSVKGTGRISASSVTITSDDVAVALGDSAVLSLSSGRLVSSKHSTVAVSGTAALTLSGTTIEHTASTDHGVAITSARYVTMTGNTVVSNGHGIYFFAPPTRGVVAGNTFNLTNPDGRSVMGNFAGVVVTGNGSNQ